LASWWRWFFLLSALICLAIYVRREWQVKNPLIDFRGLLDVRYLRAVLLQGIGAASFASLLVIGVLYLRQGLHYATWAIGVSLIPGIVVRLLVHHGTIPLLKNVSTIKRIRMATGIMMLGWGCLTIFSTYLNLLLFVILTMLIEAGHGLLIQVGKQLNQRPRSRRLINMADIFAGQFKLMATSLILTVLSVVLQNVTESWSFSGLPGQLSSLAGYRAAFLVFFIITILSWLVTMIAGRNYNLSKHIVK
jgi:DHA2 family lincomycin resistance protein-like MFS transporter